MRIKEIKKGEAEIKRGQVLMSVEGSLKDVEAVQVILKEEGYEDTACLDEIEDEIYALYFVMERNEVSNFKAAFKKAKKEVATKI